MNSFAFSRFSYVMGIPTVLPMTTTTLETLTWTVAEHGVEADRAGVRDFARAARARSLSPVLIDVLLDDAEPSMVRERAFGRLAARYALSA